MRGQAAPSFAILSTGGSELVADAQTHGCLRHRAALAPLIGPPKQQTCGMSKRPNLLMMVPVSWTGLWTTPLAAGAINPIVHGRDAYAPESIDYVLSFRPPPGILKTLPNLKAAFFL